MFGPISAFKPPETDAAWLLEARRQLTYVSSSPTWELQACKPYSAPNSATFWPRNGPVLEPRGCTFGPISAFKPPEAGAEQLLEPQRQLSYVSSSPIWEFQARKSYYAPNSATFGPQNGTPWKPQLGPSWPANHQQQVQNGSWKLKGSLPMSAVALLGNSQPASLILNPILPL